MTEASKTPARMQHFRLLISDIDGTLIQGPPRLPAALIAGLRKAEQLGLRVTLASGRNSAEVRWFLDQLEISEPYIALGGAYVADPRTDQVLSYRALSRQAVEVILEQARRREVGILLEYPDETLFEGQSGHYEEINALSASGVRRLAHGSFQLETLPGKMVLMGSEKDLQAIEGALLPWKDNLESARSLPTFLDITCNDVNKGNALRTLAAAEGIDPGQIIAMGDGWNDLSMFQQAGYAVAMGSGAPGLRRYADLVTPAEVENGFLWALEYILTNIHASQARI